MYRDYGVALFCDHILQNECAGVGVVDDDQMAFSLEAILSPSGATQ